MRKVNKQGKTPCLRRSAHLRGRGKGKASFIRSITKHGRWRGHKYTIMDYRMGLVIDVRSGRRGPAVRGGKA